MTNKEEDELIEKMLDMILKKELPDRKSEFRGFYKGKEVVLETIWYKAGGWDIRKRLVNKEFCGHEDHKNCEEILSASGTSHRCNRCGFYHLHHNLG